MKPTPIFMKQWLDANRRTRILPGDPWYLNFSAKILPLIQQSTLFGENDRDRKDAAVSLCLYFQDAIAQSGGWKAFTEMHRALYHRHLPFYPLSDSYAPDEINREDVAFVLWKLKSRTARLAPDDYTLQDPFDETLLALAREVYRLMDESFEDAPINETPSPASWVTGMDFPDKPSAPLPEVASATRLSKYAKLCLEHSDGRALQYFATYRELCHFFVEVLKWENTPSALLPDLQDGKEFVIYANAKGMLIARDVAACFCEEHNPLYNAGRAAAEGYKLFCHPGACPFDLIKYGMAKGILPDAQLPFARGKEILQQDWDFIARYYLREYYEGE